MIKFTSSSDFDFQVASVSLLRDVSKALTKRASAKSLLKFEKTAGQEDLHIIALGSYEGTGFNRNGDAFPEADCIKNHHYFVKSGRAIHRHHKNKPSDPKFGNIKASAYNPEMKRIELIVGLDRDKCADILDEQEKTGNTNWSMASKQAYDVCSWCGHKAKTDSDRCDHIPKNIGEINKQGEMCGMVNPDPRWFEMSYVRRPADRIGMSLGKMASDASIKPMLTRDFLNVYGNIYVPEDVYISKKAADKRELLKKLAEIEKHVDAIAHGHVASSKDKFIKQHGHKLNKGKKIDGKSMDELRKHEPKAALKGLADKGVILSPDDFANYAFGDRIDKKHVEGMKTHLPDVYSNLDKSNDATVTNSETFEPEGNVKPELKNTVNKLTEDHSLSGAPAVRRMMIISIMIGDPREGLKPAQEEAKTKEAFDKELAKQYATYKLAALNYINEQGNLDEDLLWNSVIQNRG